MCVSFCSTDFCLWSRSVFLSPLLTSSSLANRDVHYHDLIGVTFIGLEHQRTLSYFKLHQYDAILKIASSQNIKAGKYRKTMTSKTQKSNFERTLKIVESMITCVIPDKYVPGLRAQSSLLVVVEYWECSWSFMKAGFPFTMINVTQLKLMYLISYMLYI